MTVYVDTPITYAEEPVGYVPTKRERAIRLGATACGRRDFVAAMRRIREAQGKVAS